MDFIKSLPDGLPWHELCQRVDDYKRKYYPSSATTGATTDAADGGRIFMTSHLLSFLTRRGRAGADHETMAAIRSKLRAVDALHIPKLRVDGSGVVRDWNRALVDLTGVERSAAVGRGYADLLDERVPGLSDGYKRAAVEWLGSAADAGSPDGSDREANRRAYLFPLPLPLDHDESFDLSRDVNQGGGYVELLVARVDRLPEMFPKMIDLPEFSPTWLPIGSGRLSMKCFKRDDPDTGWEYETEDWIGGSEFTLRRKAAVPTLQSLCGRLLPSDLTNRDGSLKTAAIEPGRGKKDAHEFIADYVRTCDEFGLMYIREVMNNVRTCYRKCRVDKKAYEFSLDYSSHPKTRKVNQYVHFALGGDEILLQTVEKNKLVWRLAFRLKQGHDVVYMRYIDLWTMMRRLIEPVISDNPLSRPACLASDSAQVLPGGDSPQRTILTLKIEGIEKAGGEHDGDRYYRTGPRPYKARATIACPASLNFFQLHRAICLVMNCASSSRTRETHEFHAANEAAPYSRPITDPDCKIVQIGELYQVSEGKKIDEDDGPFVSGYGLRQRITRTGAHYDTVMPLHSVEPPMFGRETHFSINTAFACIHTTCINAVFRAPNASVVLVNGWGDYKAKFKITCTKSEQYDGPPPDNHRVNVMLAKCLRGKIEGDSYCDFSVEEANKRLHEDRGCLRRILCDFGTMNCIQQFPWAFDEGTRVERGKEYIVPLAVQLRAMDRRPIYLNGEPPLPTSDDFSKYVSTLHGKIDPKWRQENIFDMTGDFAVPLSFKPNKIGVSGCYNCVGGKTCEECVGIRWEKEADEEQEKMDRRKPKKKRASGKKRKAREKQIKP